MHFSVPKFVVAAAVPLLAASIVACSVDGDPTKGFSNSVNRSLDNAGTTTPFIETVQKDIYAQFLEGRMPLGDVVEAYKHDSDTYRNTFDAEGNHVKIFVDSDDRKLERILVDDVYPHILNDLSEEFLKFPDDNGYGSLALLGQVAFSIMRTREHGMPITDASLAAAPGIWEGAPVFVWSNNLRNNPMIKTYSDFALEMELYIDSITVQTRKGLPDWDAMSATAAVAALQVIASETRLARARDPSLSGYDAKLMGGKVSENYLNAALSLFIHAFDFFNSVATAQDKKVMDVYFNQDSPIKPEIPDRVVRSDVPAIYQPQKHLYITRLPIPYIASTVATVLRHGFLKKKRIMST